MITSTSGSCPLVPEPGLETTQIIDELIALAREMGEAKCRGEHLGLNTDELAFYEALEVNDSAVQVLGTRHFGSLPVSWLLGMELVA